MKFVVLSRSAKKDLAKVPFYIAEALATWILAVEQKGIFEVRKSHGYNDESLKGARVGQRSIRLNRSYRAIYIIKSENEIEFISVEEINKHEY